MRINKIVEEKPYLFWYIDDKKNLSNEAIVEAILNYGDWQDVKDLFKNLGIKETASIFKKGISGKRSNYRPEIKNYFSLYFKKYV